MPFSQQSLANQFQHVYYTIKSILIFVGVKDYLEDDNITLNFQPMDKTSKLYLYMFQGKEQYIIIIFFIKKKFIFINTFFC